MTVPYDCDHSTSYSYLTNMKRHGLIIQEDS